MTQCYIQMTQTKSNISEISKFFINEESLIDLADFLAYTADEIEGAVSSFEDIDLDEFDNLDEEEKEDIISSSGLWFAAAITADEVYRLIGECEQVVSDYRSLSEALLYWKDGERNPLLDSNLMSSFQWLKIQKRKRVIYELQHKAVDLISNYWIEDLFPYFGEEYFTNEALDYINETIH